MLTVLIEEGEREKICPVAMRKGATPVPIPNTTVKTHTAENTWREVSREGRWLPDFL